MTKKKSEAARFATGIRNLDALFMGGIPRGAVTVVAGPPGAGKTTLVQQICFHNASAEQRVLYFGTLSEPMAKTLSYLTQFSFFDPKKLDDGGMQFVDLGGTLRTKGLDEAFKFIMEQVKAVRPAIVVIDSFRVFDDIARSRGDLRKFGYELAINLMAWEVTTFLLGEFSPHEMETNPLFSIVDGLIWVTHREDWGEQQRFIRINKMRGIAHNRDEHAFAMTSRGVEIFAPRLELQREDRGPGTSRCRTGIEKFDALIDEGIPRGSSLLIAGVAGTGKTVLLLEFLYLGAKAGEKGIMFSFEETPERLLAAAKGLGWDLDKEIERGMIEIVFIAQPNIVVEPHLLMMQERAKALGAQRIAIDSISVFLHRVTDPQVAREKIFQLASIVQNREAVGFFATDIPYGANQISRLGVEETVVDGIVLLTSVEEGYERQRYVEIYKLRNTAHLKGRHHMTIGAGGITIFPRYEVQAEGIEPPPLELARRLETGVPGLDALCGGGLLERSVTLVSGSAGIGKSTLGLHFLLEGAKQGQRGLYVALEEGPTQITRAAESLGLPMKAAVDSGLVEIVYLSNEHVRASQFLTLITDKLRDGGARRLVLDSVSHMAQGAMEAEELRRLLYAMVVRFKSAGVTSMLMLESESMYAIDTVTERGYSPIADNIFMLRYARASGAFHPTLSIVKTRGSAHDWGTHAFSIGQGGIRVGERVRDDGTHGGTDEPGGPAGR